MQQQQKILTPKSWRKQKKKRKKMLFDKLNCWMGVSVPQHLYNAWIDQGGKVLSPFLSSESRNGEEELIYGNSDLSTQVNDQILKQLHFLFTNDETGEQEQILMKHILTRDTSRLEDEEQMLFFVKSQWIEDCIEKQALLNTTEYILTPVLIENTREETGEVSEEIEVNVTSSLLLDESYNLIIKKQSIVHDNNLEYQQQEEKQKKKKSIEKRTSPVTPKKLKNDKQAAVLKTRHLSDLQKQYDIPRLMTHFHEFDPSEISVIKKD
jgi:hypothetical protein